MGLRRNTGTPPPKKRLFLCFTLIEPMLNRESPPQKEQQQQQAQHDMLKSLFQNPRGKAWSQRQHCSNALRALLKLTMLALHLLWQTNLSVCPRTKTMLHFCPSFPQPWYKVSTYVVYGCCCYNHLTCFKRVEACTSEMCNGPIR